jgi:predicted phage terminase large subunit-like protein
MDDSNADKLLNLSEAEVRALPDSIRETVVALRRQVFAARKLQKMRTAQNSLLEFAKSMMPHPDYPDDSSRSRYQVHKVHEFIAEKLEQVERGEILRLIISVQPRIGKSQIATKLFPAWAIGRQPTRQIITVGYGEEFVTDFGSEVRDTLASDRYKAIFPEARLRKGQASVKRQKLQPGGILNFVGVGGSITGRGADIALIDDPIKGDKDSLTKRAKDEMWEWYSRVLLTRMMGRAGAQVITMTRWAEDDLIGRLTNPELGYVTERQAKQWTVINIPAFAEEDDPLDRAPGEVLWEERTSRVFLENFRELDPGGFASLYMGRPSPPEGNHFLVQHLQTYQPQDLPRELRYYAASDHAVSLEQNRDKTCLMLAGVDRDDNIWILPDLVWSQIDTEAQVEAMLGLMGSYPIMDWWAERPHYEAIAPFLRKRMREESIYCSIVVKHPIRDKLARSQSIRSRMSQGKVKFPGFAPWWGDAKAQLLNFPNDAHDDFCVVGDTLVTMADGSTQPIMRVAEGDSVLTPAGARKVTASTCTGMAEVYRVTFDDGARLIGTGNHPVATPNGFVRLDSLSWGSAVISEPHTEEKGSKWQFAEQVKRMWSSTKATAIGAIRTVSMTIIVNTITQRSLEGASYTAIYGKMPTAASLMGTTSTTKITTRSIMHWKTWNAYPPASTERSTSASGRAPRKTSSIWLEFGLWLRSGTGLKKAGRGMQKWLPIRGTSVSEGVSSAVTASRSLKRLFRVEQNTVAQRAVTPLGTERTGRERYLKAHGNPATGVATSSRTPSEPNAIAASSAGRKSVISVEKLSGTQAVYNLTVEGEHVYYANGILTHNCDALSWLGIGLNRQVRAEAPIIKEKKAPRTGTLDWILASSEHERQKAPYNKVRYLQ